MYTLSMEYSSRDLRPNLDEGQSKGEYLGSDPRKVNWLHGNKVEN